MPSDTATDHSFFFLRQRLSAGGDLAATLRGVQVGTGSTGPTGFQGKTPVQAAASVQQMYSSRRPSATGRSRQLTTQPRRRFSCTFLWLRLHTESK